MFDHGGFGIFAQTRQAFVVAVEAPDVVGVLAGAGQRTVEAQIGAVDGFGFFDMALLQQQRAQRVAGGLHPAPGFVVAHVVIDIDGGSEMAESLFEIALAVFDFAAQHFGGNLSECRGWCC